MMPWLPCTRTWRSGPQSGHFLCCTYRALHTRPVHNEHMRAEIIAVGTELLSPSRQDTNSLFITERLNGIGIEVGAKCIVGDDPATLSTVFVQALERADLVILTGGLGPTDDDVTRDV